MVSCWVVDGGWGGVGGGGCWVMGVNAECNVAQKPAGACVPPLFWYISKRGVAGRKMALHALRLGHWRIDHICPVAILASSSRLGSSAPSPFLPPCRCSMGPQKGEKELQKWDKKLSPAARRSRCGAGASTPQASRASHAEGHIKVTLPAHPATLNPDWLSGCRRFYR